MNLCLQGAYLHFFPDFRAHIERRLERTLGRFRAPIDLATVRLSGRTRWRCQIRLTIPGAGPIAAQAVRPMPSEAIDAALDRLVEPLDRAMARRPRRRRQQHLLPEAINRKGSPT